MEDAVMEEVVDAEEVGVGMTNNPLYLWLFRKKVIPLPNFSRKVSS